MCEKEKFWKTKGESSSSCMLLPKTAHFAPGLRCDTITKNVYPGAAAMEYIMQRKQDGNTCGAFVLAYYQWEKAGCETVQEEAGRAYVEQLYREIVFGSTMPGFETYSNPVLMMRWLAQQGTRPCVLFGRKPFGAKDVCRAAGLGRGRNCRAAGGGDGFAAKRWTFAVQGNIRCWCARWKRTARLRPSFTMC